jgi:hypothetical protein
VGNITVVDSRFDGNSLIDGATNPDFSLKLGNSCHDSVYRNLSAFDGTKADILEYNGNLFSQIHLNSDAANSNTGNASSVSWAANTRLAGVADYGFYTLGNTSLSQTQCDIANFACVHTATNPINGTANPAQITDTQMKCGSLVSVPSTYYGVELAAGTISTTVSGTAAAGKCNIPGVQLVHLDGSIDSTVTLCNNSNATVMACGSGSGLAAGRFYTQPALAYTTVALASNTLYAVPFDNPSGGTISKLGAQVTATGTATQCDLGVYSALGGAPGSLLLDSGQIAASAVGMKVNTGLNLVLLPNTLYFLAMGCNGTVTVEATGSASGLTGVLVGLPDFVTSASTSVSVAWTYGAFSLPASFGAASYASSTVVPNVYVGP